METPALRLLIRQKLSDGQLPRNGVPKVWGGAGAGQRCDACDKPVAKTDLVMEGPVLNGGRKAREVQFHVLCFHVWDDERHRAERTTPPSTPGAVPDTTEYLDYLITTATEQQGGKWAVAVTIHTAEGVLAMESADLGDSVTFNTKAIAEHAGVLFARAWIDRRKPIGTPVSIASTPDRERLSRQLRELVKLGAPFTFCDACLALRFRETLEDTRAAALLLARDNGFMRRVRVCTGCTRAVEMTEITT